MALQLDDLDDETRRYMLSEMARDSVHDDLYMSRYFSEEGRRRYPVLIREALEVGTDASLAEALSSPAMFETHHQRRKPSGGHTTAKVPDTAPVTFAEGEFNRFYLRGLCARIVESGGGVVEIYRARYSERPRAESVAMEGTTLNAATLLDDLRTSQGVDTALGLPPGPNSGLSARIPRS
jgi:hypothetical protein